MGAATNRHLFGEQELLPFVADSYGALGASALAFLRKLVPHYARRVGISPAVASRIVFGRITICVIHGMAQLACLA